MKTRKISLACVIGAVLVAGIATTRADENADALRAAPAPVQLAVIQLVGTDKIKEFDSEVEGGKTIYDVEYSVKNASYEADIDATGQILTREVEVALSIVPPAVIDAAKKAHADGKLREASIITAGSKMYYEVEAKVGKENHEMQIDAGGVLIGDSVEAPEPDEQAEKSGEKGGDKD